MTEFILAGTAAALAGVITNPLEVVKTRIQLQGELMSRGLYTVHYRNVFRAFFVIAKNEGVLSLQKGLVPAIYYQFTMNGARLGFFQFLDNINFIRNAKGELTPHKVIIASAASGALGSFIGSPLYMIKTQLQSRSSAQIAVGHQHEHTSFRSAFCQIYFSQGIGGLWRGASASILRTSVASSVQLSTFSMVEYYLLKNPILQNNPLIATLFSSIIGGFTVSTAMTPFDVVSTRLYNQPTDPSTRKGLTYSGIYDCARKIFVTEGLYGFYKGWTASFLRIGPHTVLSLCFWKQIRKYYLEFKDHRLQELP